MSLCFWMSNFDISKERCGVIFWTAWLFKINALGFSATSECVPPIETVSHSEDMNPRQQRCANLASRGSAFIEMLC